MSNECNTEESYSIRSAVVPNTTCFRQLYYIDSETFDCREHPFRKPTLFVRIGARLADRASFGRKDQGLFKSGVTPPF
jgi:hypothetical protein